MAFCSNCGQQLPEGANACPNCGTFVNRMLRAASLSSAQPSADSYQQAPFSSQYQQNYQQPPRRAISRVTRLPQGYAQPYVTPDMDVQQSKGIAWLSYMGLLFLIPMFVRRQSDYTRFHVKQGVTLFAVELAYGVNL